MKKVRVGIIGYGVMGKMHAEVWSGIPQAELVAIADPVKERQQEAAIYDPDHCEIFDYYRAMIDRKNLDVVVVATHAPHHHLQTMSALYNGCHVICEKPMALTLQECDQMINCASVCRRELAINHQSIFSRAVTVADQKIAAGDMGELYAINAYGKGRIACSDLMEIAGHLLHVMRHFAKSEPTEVFGDVTMNGRLVTREDAVRVQDLYPEGRDSGMGAGDRIHGYYKFASGIRGELHLAQLNDAPSTFGESRNFGYYVELMGTAGRMQFYLPRVLFFNASPLDDLAKSATPWVEVDPSLREEKDPVLIRRLNLDLLQAIQEDRSPIISGEVGRTVMEMTLGVYASHLAGRPLALPLALRRHPFSE